MKTIFTVLLLLILSVAVSAQPTYLNLTGIGDIPSISILTNLHDGALVYGEHIAGAGGFDSRRLFIKLAPDGSIVWARATAYEHLEDESYFFSMLEHHDGTIFLSGVTNKREKNADGTRKNVSYQTLCKISPEGTMQQVAAFTDSCPLGSLLQLQDGTIAVAGNSNLVASEVASIGFYDSSLAHQTVLTLTHPFTGPYAASRQFVSEMADNTLIVAGSYLDYLTVMHLSRSGDIISKNVAAFPTNSFVASALTTRPDGTVILCGILTDTNSPNVQRRCCVAAIDPTGVIRSVISVDPLTKIGGCTVQALASNEIIISTFSNTNSDLSHYFLLDKDLNVRRAVAPTIFKGLSVASWLSLGENGQLTIAGRAIKNGNYDTIRSFWGTLTASLDGCGLSDELVAAGKEPFTLTANFTITATVRTLTSKPLPLSLEEFTSSTVVSPICDGITNEVTPQLPAVVSVVNPVRRSSPIVLHPSSITAGSYRVVIRDALGKMVYSGEQAFGDGEVRISSDGISSGLYVIELQNVNSFTSLWRGKIVVE